MKHFKSKWSWSGFFSLIAIFAIVSWALDFYPGAPPPRNPWHKGDIALVVGTDVRVTIVARMLGGRQVLVVYADNLGAIHEETVSVYGLTPIK